MIPTEFKKLKDLRRVDDKGLNPEMLLLLESGEESVSAFLSQIKSWVLNETIDSLNPVGAPIFWPNDQIPQGYAKINDGLDFSVIQYPLLALAWPSGKIPPHKGLVIECTADGETTGDTLKGEIKSHSHASKISNSGEHSHDPGSLDLTGSINVRKCGEGIISKTGVFSGSKTNIEQSAGHAGSAFNSNLTINLKGINNFSGDVGRSGNHTHTSDISETGATRNTVDRINYNVIVRLA